MAGTVLVSGGSGYIAGYLIRQLVGEGWTVHTTVRSLAKENTARKLLAVDATRLRFFAADLMHDAGWDSAMQNCSHVAHVASPIPARTPKDENDLIIPARDGALRALRAARRAGIKRFVMTSSVAAIAYGYPKGDRTFTEAQWTDETHPDAGAYARSKTIAERAAREWVAREGGDMAFCTINPCIVLGPVWGADYSPSIEVVKKLLDGSVPGCPDLGFSLVDVRDVADLHVRALTAPDMAGERFIAAGQYLKLIEIAHILKDRLGTQAHKVPARRLPDFLMKVAALFDPLVRQVVGDLGNVRRMDASHARAVLGWQARTAEDSIVDTARSLIELGIVKV